MQNAPPGPAPNYPIESVDKALRVMKLFMERTSITVSEASDELEVGRSTAHRLLAMLVYHGFVRQDPRSRVYVPGPTLVDLGLAVVRQMDVRQVARPYLAALANDVGETVHLATLVGTEVVYVECVEGPRAVRFGNRVGMTVPAYSGAMGKALLAELDTEEIHRLFPSTRLHRVTPRSPGTRRELEDRLDEVRRDGYATNVEENEAGLSSIAAAVTDARGILHGAVSVGGPSDRLPLTRLREFAPKVVGCAHQIGEALS
jgi:DNA-binding IclR family transcriptional regulator